MVIISTRTFDNAAFLFGAVKFGSVRLIAVEQKSDAESGTNYRESTKQKRTQSQQYTYSRFFANNCFWMVLFLVSILLRRRKYIFFHLPFIIWIYGLFGNDFFNMIFVEIFLVNSLFWWRNFFFEKNRLYFLSLCYHFLSIPIYLRIVVWFFLSHSVFFLLLELRTLLTEDDKNSFNHGSKHFRMCRMSGC